MGDENEISIIIKAVSNAEGVMKAIATDTRALVTILSRLEKSLNTVNAAQKANVAATSASSKEAVNAAKVTKLSAEADLQKAKAAATAAQAEAKVTTEMERAAAVLLKSQADISKVNAQAATENQRRLTEEQRTNKAIADEALNRARKVAEIIEVAAKADAQVAGIQIRNNAAVAKAERDKQREYEKTAKAAEQKAKAEKRAADNGGFIADLKGFVNDFGPAIAAITAFGVATKKAFDLAQEGANLERLRVTGTALAKSFGVDMVDAVAKIKAASLGTLTSQQALLATNRALLLGISGDTDQLANIMQIAAIRGRALGLDTTTSFDRIILGIGRLSTRILDDLGIVIDGEQAYADYGAAIGKTADQLTEAEKRIALTNAIIADGNKILADTGGVVDDNAAKFERFNASLVETKNRFTEALGALGPYVDGLNAWFFAQRDAIDIAVAHGSVMVKLSNDYGTYKEELDRVAKSLFLQVNANGDLVRIYPTLLGNLEEVVVKNYELSEAQFDAAKSAYELSEADKTAGVHSEQLAEYLIKLKAQQDANAASIEKLITTTDKLSFEQAAQSAIDAALAYKDFNGNSITTDKQLQAMQVQFGLLDMAVQKFQQDIIEAGKDGVVSMEEFRDAFAPVADAQITKLRDQLGKDLFDIDADMFKKLDKLNQDIYDGQLKNALENSRDLEDIENDKVHDIEDLNTESAAKREDEDRKHKDKLVDIERDYQRDVDKIMRKFEMSRLKALIDGDARALFEAEQQRDMDLKDAKDSAKDKRADESKDYEKKLKDLDDYNKEKKDAIEKDYKRGLEDAKRNYDRQAADFDAAMTARRQDITDDATMRAAELAKDFEDQKSIIDMEMGRQQTTYQDAYNERVKDLLDFFDTNENILLALQAGTVSLSDLRDQFSTAGGIPFGGIPFTPNPTQPPTPPSHNCPYGWKWDPIKGECVNQNSGGDMAGLSVGSETSPVVGTVRLEIVGDGALAQMVRQSAVNVFADIIAD